MRIPGCVSRVSKEGDMTYRIPRVRGQSLRDYPTYSIPEAALILAMSRRTLQSWVYDKPIFAVSGSDQYQRLLSFRDLAQFYFLKFVRQNAGLSDAQARNLLRYTKEVTDSEYPLLHENISVLPRHVFLTTKQNAVLDLINPRGQYVFKDIVSIFASRVDRDKRGLMVRLYPWRLWRDEKDYRRPVSVDPNILSGRLVITGTRIPALVVASRRKMGESISEIARDYSISQQRVTESLRHLHIGIRKAA
jgi:uncharacterized protein (DUF433 family)/DNA-binding transcriptional MerR regulator